MRAPFLAAILAIASITPAFGGAWTLPQGVFQIIGTSTTSVATHSFDDNGDPTIATGYKKILMQALAEYGLTDSITLFVDPEYAIALSGPPYSQAKDAAFGGGVRYRITDAIGVLSVQAMVKTAGAFDLSVSSHGVSGRQAELRLLYGTNFKFLRRNGFVNLEVAERLVSGAAPNETPIDLTVGWHLTPRYMLMAQSFNIIAGGDSRPPYVYYRSHKLELSLVELLSRHWELQTGAFFSPAGQNALQETGVSVSLWARF